MLIAARYRRATRASPFEDVRGGGASLFDATRRRLELWDISERDINRLLETRKIQKNLTLYAPSSGVVTKLGVRVGMEVESNQNLYTIADLSEVWVLAGVYEYELPWLALGQTGTVELPYLAGKESTLCRCRAASSICNSRSGSPPDSRNSSAEIVRSFRR